MGPTQFALDFQKHDPRTTSPPQSDLSLARFDRYYSWILSRVKSGLPLTCKASPDAGSHPRVVSDLSELSLQGARYGAWCLVLLVPSKPAYVP